MELRFRQPPRACVNCDARCQSERRLQHDFALTIYDPPTPDVSGAQTPSPRALRAQGGHSVALHLTYYVSRIPPRSPRLHPLLIVCPLRMRRAATPVSMTAGIPNSLATMELPLSGTTCRPRCCRSDLPPHLKRPRSRRPSWPACQSCASDAAPWQVQRGSKKQNRYVKSPDPCMD